MGCVSGIAVDRRRRDENDAADAGLERGGEERRGAFDVHGVDLVAGAADRESGGGVDEDRGAGNELTGPAGVADVAAELLDLAREAGLVERRQVQRSHGVAARETPREVQPEESRPA